MTNPKKFAISIVMQAGEILKKYYVSKNFSIREKSSIDLATQADDDVDSFIKEKLSKEFPTHLVLTEETAPKDFSEFKKAKYLWILDPIDGTVNFSRGNPDFAISLAFATDSKVRLGIIYSPIHNKIYIGESGQKPMENNNPMEVSKTSSLQKSVLLCDWAWAKNDRENITKKLLKVCSNVRGIRSLECFVLAAMQLAKGDADLYMTIGQKPWDSAAASLIIESSGGEITNLDGSEWNIFSQEILVSNSILHENFLKMLQ